MPGDSFNFKFVRHDGIYLEVDPQSFLSSPSMLNRTGIKTLLAQHIMKGVCWAHLKAVRLVDCVVTSLYL